MNEKTITKLNQINKDFYSTIATDFDKTRSYYWEGWDRLYETLPMNGFQLGKRLRVLDLGCGNGRFASFLIDQGEMIDYIGLDQSEALITAAKDKFKNYKGESSVRFENFDLVEDELGTIMDGQEFDLIVLFGVVHHIPSREIRFSLLDDLAQLLSQKGVIAFTSWNFLDEEKYKGRVIDWEEVGISKDKVEKGDYLLDWRRGKVAVRYCHYLDGKELSEYLEQAKIVLIDQYRADGKSGKLNTYYILGGSTY